MPEVDLVSWSESWLKTAGCNSISLDIESDEAGKVVRFDVKQEIYNHEKTPSNRLRL
jgi:hypothetical protein